MTTNPQSYLAPQSQPWGRFVDKSLADITETTRLNTLNTSNNLKQLNSSVNLLSNQQAALATQQETLANQQVALATQQNYLSSLVTYVTYLPYVYMTHAQGYTTVAESTATFTLTRNAKVLISSEAEYDIGLTGTGAGDTRGRLYVLMYNGATNLEARSWENTHRYTGHSMSLTQVGTASMQRYLTLTPGTYTIKFSYSFYLISDIGVSGQVQDLLLNVSVVN